MASNSSLNTAKVVKNDESYTRLGDIEKELRHYKPHFKGKAVHCNCDDPESSEFYAYFKRFFQTLKLRCVICTGMSVNQKTWMKPVGVMFDGKNEKNLKIENGDFASSECMDLMDKSDIVVTNPPFSLFRKYMDKLMIWSGGGARKFCVQGNINAVKYKEIFPLFHAQKIWLGASPIGDSYFYVPSHLPCKSKTTKHDDSGRLMKQVRTARWYTNIDHESRHEPYDLTEKYSSAVYPKYDNYNAIEVTRSADIPYDYDGVMGVPTTFLDRLCPEQFEIVDLLSAPKCEEYRNRNPENKDPFARLLIRNLFPGTRQVV